MKVLFICRGNAGRSQMAQSFYNSLTNSSNATSAGTHPKPVKEVPPEVIEAMKMKNVAMDGQYRKTLTNDMFDEAEKVVLITDEFVPEYVKGEKVVFWDIADPGDRPMPELIAARDEIKKRVEELVHETYEHDRHT